MRSVRYALYDASNGWTSILKYDHPALAEDLADAMEATFPTVYHGKYFQIIEIDEDGNRID